MPSRAAALLVVLGVAAPARAGQAWRAYGAGEGFLVELPGEARVTVEPIEGVEARRAVVDRGDASFALTWMDVAVDADDLDAERDTLVKSAGFRIVAEKRFALDGKWPALDVRIAGPHGRAGRVLIVATGARLYTLMGLGPARRKDLARDLEHLVGSFHIDEPERSAPARQQ